MATGATAAVWPIWDCTGGRRIGPYVEQTYLQLLEQRYLPSLFNGLVKAMNAAPPESEEKLAVLRVMRMLEDKSGRNNEVVKQYMAKRWSEKFHGQRDIQGATDVPS